MTRVAYLGNFRHPWCTEVHMTRSLESLGCDVLRLQEDEQTPGSIEREVQDFGAETVIYTRTWGLPSTLIDTWRRLEAAGVVTASFHLDLYLGLKREATLAGDPFWATQHVFTPDGDPASAEKFVELGINHHWSPPAAMHDECVMGEWRGHFDHDVIFVGSGHYHPEHPFRVQLLHWLRRTYQSRYVQYGGDGARVVRDRDLNDLYRSARCVVGDSLTLPGRTNYWSDRVCETLGRGGVLVFPDVPGLRDFMGLKNGMHCWFYNPGDFETLKSRIDWCVANPDDGRKMAARGQAQIRAHHTYVHRLAAALQVMGLRDNADVSEFEIVTFGEARPIEDAEPVPEPT